MRLAICLATTVILLSAPFALAAQAQPANDPATKTVVYDIRGLLQPINNYEQSVNWSTGQRLVPNGGGGGGNILGGAETPEDKLVTKYIKLIEDTVDSDTWRDNGGQTGIIREIEGMLIITHTEDVHTQVDALLKQLMDKHSRLVRVRIHWLLGTDEQLQFGEGAHRNMSQRVIDSGLLDKLPKDVTHHQAETVCFSGQSVHITSGQAHAYVSDLNPVVASDAVGFDPELSMYQDGAKATVTPTVQSDGKSVILDLHSTVSAWSRGTPVDLRDLAGSSTTKPSAQKPIGPSVLDRPEVQMQTLDTTLRVPLGSAMIVGGMTLEPGLTGPSGPRLLVVVEVFSE